MPELPEVETTVRGLAPVILGQRLRAVEVRRADLRRAFPVDLRQRMEGAVVTTVGRRAKYGLVHTDRGDSMVFHLGMSGRWRVDPERLIAHDHLVIATEQGRRVTLNDPRRFGFVDLVPTESLAAYPPFVNMGPEPLGSDLTGNHLFENLNGRTAPIKAMLLNQSIVAGLGNIYVCEALHMAGIAPDRPSGQIALPRLERLVDAIRHVLIAAIEAGGSTLRDFAAPDGELGYFSKQFLVYGREGEPCVCGTPVRRRAEGGRSTFWCPQCQKS